MLAKLIATAKWWQQNVFSLTMSTYFFWSFVCYVIAGIWCIQSSPLIEAYLCRIDAEDTVHHKTYIPTDMRPGLGCDNCTDKILTCGASFCVQKSFYKTYTNYGAACPLNVSSRVDEAAIKDKYEQMALDAINDPLCNAAVGRATTVPLMIVDIVMKRAAEVAVASDTMNLKRCQQLHCQTMLSMFVKNDAGGYTADTMPECQAGEAAWAFSHSKTIFDGCFDAFSAHPTILSEHSYRRVAKNKNTCLRSIIEQTMVDNYDYFFKFTIPVIENVNSQDFKDANTCFTILDTNVDIVTLIHTIMKEKIRPGQPEFDAAHICGKFFCTALTKAPTVSACLYESDTTSPDALKDLHNDLIAWGGAPQNAADVYETMDIPTYCNEATSNILSISNVKGILQNFQNTWLNVTGGAARQLRRNPRQDADSVVASPNARRLAELDHDVEVIKGGSKEIEALVREDTKAFSTAKESGPSTKRSPIRERIPDLKYGAVEELLNRILGMSTNKKRTVVASFDEVNDYRHDFSQEHVILREDLDGIGNRFNKTERKELDSAIDILWPKRSTDPTWSQIRFPSEVGPCGRSINGNKKRGTIYGMMRYDLVEPTEFSRRSENPQSLVEISGLLGENPMFNGISLTEMRASENEAFAKAGVSVENNLMRNSIPSTDIHLHSIPPDPIFQLENLHGFLPGVAPLGATITIDTRGTPLGRNRVMVRDPGWESSALIDGTMRPASAVQQRNMFYSADPSFHRSLDYFGITDMVISFSDLFFGPDGLMGDWIESESDDSDSSSSSAVPPSSADEAPSVLKVVSKMPNLVTYLYPNLLKDSMNEASRTIKERITDAEGRIESVEDGKSDKLGLKSSPDSTETVSTNFTNYDFVSGDDGHVGSVSVITDGDGVVESSRDPELVEKRKKRRLQSNDDLPDYEEGDWSTCECYTMCMPGLRTRKVDCFAEKCSLPKPSEKEACNCTHCADCQVLLNLLIIAVCYFVQAFVALVVFLGFVYFGKKKEDDLVGLNICQKCLGCMCKKLPMTVRVLTITMFFQLALLSVQAFCPYNTIKWQADCKFREMWITSGVLLGVWFFQLIFGMISKMVIEVPAYLYTPFVRGNGFVFRFKQLLRALGP